MKPVLVFDVNETLLDLAALDPLFVSVLGDGALRPTWFATMLQLSFVGGLTGQYVDFTTAQKAALRMTARRVGREVGEREVEAIVGAMRRLPAHAEVPDALERLRAVGFRLTALTNSVLDVATAQLTYAGLIEQFEAVYSADEVQALKPASAPYRMVAQRCAVEIGDLCLIAAHAWDVSGALAAGCQAAFVGRAGGVASPLGKQPAVSGGDLTEVADAVLQRFPE